jgi:hypothetical protein
MKKLLPSSYFETQERLCEWFEELKQAAGCGENADIGAVLRKVEAMARKIETYEEQQDAVAKWRGYRFWGDCYNAAANEQPEDKAIELLRDYQEAPGKWRKTYGWDKAEKDRKKALKTISVVLASIEKDAESEGPEWAEEMRGELLRTYRESKSLPDFEKDVNEFMFPEEDPATTWVPIAEEAAAVLEKDTYLPTTAVEELIAYAYQAEVEMTKEKLAIIAGSEVRPKPFFYYLLTACFHSQRRVSEEQVERITNLVRKALDYWGCYDPKNNPSGCYKEESNHDPLRPGMKRVYLPEISVEQLLAGSRIIYLAEEDGERWGSHDEIAEAVRAAVKQPETAQALIATHKK